MGCEEKFSKTNGGLLNCAVLINVILSVVQFIAGFVSGSLSLAADALHNLSDAGSIVVAIIARKIGQKAPNPAMTYGYKRAEIIGVLINSSILIAIGIFLIYQAGYRYFHPAVIDGWIVFWVAGIAFLVDFATCFLTYHAGAKHNMNIQAVFIHNVADTLASLAVIVAGLLIILFDLYIVDVLTTVGISVYVIFHGLKLLKKAILIIMQAVPAGICVHEMKQSIESINEVSEVKKIHVWQLDEERIVFEGNVSIDTSKHEPVKSKIRDILKDRYNISHSTIETVVG